MKKLKMIIFDYGQTLVNEKPFDGLKGTKAVLEKAASTAKPTNNIEKLLEFLDEANIRTSVISNIVFIGNMLKARINRYILSNKFDK